MDRIQLLLMSGVKNFRRVWSELRPADPDHEKSDYLFNMHRPIDARVGEGLTVLIQCHLQLCMALTIWLSHLYPGQQRVLSFCLLLICLSCDRLPK